jgi:hypothetical protein
LAVAIAARRSASIRQSNENGSAGRFTAITANA